MIVYRSIRTTPTEVFGGFQSKHQSFLSGSCVGHESGWQMAIDLMYKMKKTHVPPDAICDSNFVKTATLSLKFYEILNMELGNGLAIFGKGYSYWKSTCFMFYVKFQGSTFPETSMAPN